MINSGRGGVYVSFSGGKDSTVLLDLVRQEYKNVRGMFIDTGLEYPEIREFVKKFDNIDWVRPSMNFRSVIEKYGYPFISKETSECIYDSKIYLSDIERKNKTTDNQDEQIDKSARYWYRYEKLCGIGDFDDNQSKSAYSCTKWKFLLDSPFAISNRCCNIMKKSTAKKYFKENNRVPILANMASESKLRTQAWLKHGCNAFDGTLPKSSPMSFWTEQDVLAYIKIFNIEVADIYGHVVTFDNEEIESTDGWMDAYIFDGIIPALKFSGVQRTGCVFCGFGCHLEKDGEGRFEMLKETHPKLYEYVFRPWDRGGLGYKEVIDWLNEHGNLHIKY